MATGACRILVVDDDQDTAQTFAFLLVGMGHEAIFLTDSSQVVDTVNRVKPHMIFLDIGMPGLNGWEVARLLRKQYPPDRKSTRLNSSHSQISYAVFCLKKKKKNETVAC